MNRIVGIFDLARSGGALGALLILLEELEIQRQIHVAEKADVIFVSDAGPLAVGVTPQVAVVPGGLVSNISALMAVTRAMSGVAGCHECLSQTSIDNALRLVRNSHVVWPDPECLVQGGHNYDSTSRIQSYFAQFGSIPRLSVATELLGWAKSYLSERAERRLPVAVHLKNNPNVRGQSNANLTSWMTFFMNKSSCNAHFFLLGDDATDEAFSALPNVTITKNDGIGLDGYLALIQAAELFMGMMSGPCNLALFTGKPYIVFKNPDHHAKEMAAELGDSDHYSFALPNQRVLRIWDTPENLLSAFDTATSQIVTSRL